VDVAAVRVDAAAKVVAAVTADAEACDNNDVAHDDTRDDSMYDNACNGVHDNTHDNGRDLADDAWAVVEVVAARAG
jgi:hypothetical protein